jgi:hypothetical protein
MSPSDRFALVLLLTTTGCAAEPAGIDSGLPASKQGKELTPVEQEKFCDATFAHLDAELGAERKEANCRTDAVITATFFVTEVDVAKCEESYQKCLAEPEEVETEACAIPIPWETCGATVADLEACYTHYMDATAEIYQTVTCANIEEYRKRWPGEDYVPSEDCQRAEAVCPDVLPVDVEDGPG